VSWPSQIPLPPTIATPVITKPEVPVPAGANLAPCNVSGTRYRLAPGDYTIDNSISATLKDVSFVGAMDTTGHPLARIIVTGYTPSATENRWKSAKAWSLGAGSERVEFDHLDFSVTHQAQAGVGVRGVDIAIRNCVSHFQLAQLQGCSRVLIDHWTAGILPAYGIVCAPGPVNSNVVIQNSVAGGSQTQHITRNWSFDGIWLIDNDFTNTNGGPGQVVNLREGKNAYIVRGHYKGSEVFGPLEIASQPDSDRVESVWIADSNFSVGGWQLPSGLIDLRVWNTAIDVTADSYVFTLRRSYHGRPMAQGTFANCPITGKLLASNESPLPLNTLLKFPAVASVSSFNGKPL
jgi:hypothetical protein